MTGGSPDRRRGHRVLEAEDAPRRHSSDHHDARVAGSRPGVDPRRARISVDQLLGRGQHGEEQAAADQRRRAHSANARGRPGLCSNTSSDRMREGAIRERQSRRILVTDAADHIAAAAMVAENSLPISRGAQQCSQRRAPGPPSRESARRDQALDLRGTNEARGACGRGSTQVQVDVAPVRRDSAIRRGGRHTS